MKKFEMMTDAELNDRTDELSKILDTCTASDPRWDEAYDEYFTIRAIQQDRYRRENQTEFDAFYEEHIKGKKWEEIDPDDWSWYSDWHKDMYGYRPRTI